MNLRHIGIAGLTLVPLSSSFIAPPRTSIVRPCAKLHVERDEDGNIKKGPIEFLMDPKPTKIPLELREDIYKAESNTEAARQRQGRIFNYGVVAIVLVFCAFGNVFLTELRSTLAEGNGAPMSLEDMGWGWVNMNFLFQFLFSSKIGGVVALVGGASAALLVEAEQDTGRKNAEAIWEELERRRALKKPPTRKKKKGGSVSPSPKKKQSSAQKKRLAALSEVVVGDDETEKAAIEEQSLATEADANLVQKDEGLMGKLKSWYAEADSMAASQALLLNKELEDKGILDKITDESGLKVIGKEAAAKAKEKEETDK